MAETNYQSSCKIGDIYHVEYKSDLFHVPDFYHGFGG